MEAVRDAAWFAEFGRPSGELALWAARSGERLEPSPTAPEPVLRELAGDWRGAVRAWRELDAPYEAALAALPGDDRAARGAVAALQRLGARAAAREFARARSERGSRAPRGPQRATLANVAGLTRREQEVLVHVASGETNQQIARALHLSERTVAHHVSAILSKLGVATRTAAVDAAHAAGMLPGDRTSMPQI
ncbi:MAG: response regulator transcription factor [Solirubrobacteraceae bacterium]